MKRSDLAGKIYDVLVDAPDGLELSDIATKTHMSVDSCRVAMRELRLILCEGDTLFVTAEPNGPRAPWIYKLVDGSVVIDPEKSGWAIGRIHDAQSRVHLLAAAMQPAVRATDGRTLDGKKARLLAKVLTRLDEDLLDLDEGKD